VSIQGEDYLLLQENSSNEVEGMIRREEEEQIAEASLPFDRILTWQKLRSSCLLLITPWCSVFASAAQLWVS